MIAINIQIENLDFIAPQSIQHVKIDVQSGELVNENCPEENVIEEIFVSGTEPTTYCGVH